MEHESGNQYQNTVETITTLLSSIPDNADDVAALETFDITKHMRDFDLISLAVHLDSPDKEEQWSKLHERYKLLQTELDKRIKDFVVPEQYMAAARIFSSQVTAERDYLKWQSITKDWKALSDSDPMYAIALKLTEAELPIHSHDRESILAEARKLIKKYFES